MVRPGNGWSLARQRLAPILTTENDTMDSNVDGGKPHARSSLLFQGCPTCVMKALAAKGKDLERMMRLNAHPTLCTSEEAFHSCHDEERESFLSDAGVICLRILSDIGEPENQNEIDRIDNDEDEERYRWFKAGRLARLIGLGYLRESLRFISNHRETALEAEAARMRALDRHLATMDHKAVGRDRPEWE